MVHKLVVFSNDYRPNVNDYGIYYEFEDGREKPNLKITTWRNKVAFELRQIVILRVPFFFLTGLKL